jgi:peptidylamidoglycolate lyase
MVTNEIALLLAMLSTLTASGMVTGVGSPDYRVVHGWPQLPEGENLGQATGVGVDSHGNVWVFHRTNHDWTGSGPATPLTQPPIWIFDGHTGRLLRTWGAGLFLIPHGLTIDKHDNVWLTDTGLHQVFKFSPDGRMLLKLGQARTSGADMSHFSAPTSVAVLDDGSFYVSDGYGNTRVLKFAADGTFQYAWGTPGNGPGQFNLPHDVAVDGTGRVYVADRGNSRVQVFDSHGVFLEEWHGADLGRPFGVMMGPGERIFVVDGGDNPQTPPDRSGVAILDRSGRILRRFGRYGNYDGQFRTAHAAAIGPDGAVYVVDITGQRVQKFVPR